MILLNLIFSSAVALWITSRLCRSSRWRILRTASNSITQLGWFGMLLISVAVSAASYVIMPKPKQARPAAAKEMDSPVAEAGKPIAVVAGTITCSELNVLWTGDKSIKSYDVTVS
ncbi:hypothetical protein [Sphingobium lignivorans]|uniref:Type IV secretory pathway protease TraF n=1 Tax=Sphingobium lignivorans TaxID=2735886 RepID=A0ABR6NH34_9SPHN|nr:hypothetical protein [Sphingobium lignivorans]MBB5985942.1 type IV secretory pathway protease TraF [Sphingobium lignivorans]